MPHWEQAILKLRQLKADIPTITGAEMVSFALDNIRAEAWEGRKWQSRKPESKRNSGRGLLVDTGIGRRSIRVEAANQREVRLTANDYMQAHNEGVNRTVSARSRRGKTFSRNMNLPKRQFTGKSAKQTERIERIIARRIVAALT